VKASVVQPAARTATAVRARIDLEACMLGPLF
jgi:hypothetical protein